MDRKFVYLDNAATTWPKPDVVYEAINECVRRLGANPGRSSHRMSIQAEQLVQEARLLLAKFFNAPSPDHVIFTLNCTDSLNIALKGLLRAGKKAITGPYEHNSVMRPLRRLQSAGVSVSVARGTEGLRVDMDHFRELCLQGVDVAVVSHASNVTGCIQPIAEMAEVVHQNGGILVLDAAQTAGTTEIDMMKLGVDVLAAPGHKGLLGPMGVGILIVGPGLEIDPFREGGTGFRSEDDFQPRDLPWGLEAGTPNLPGIAGLAAGIRFIQSVGIDSISAREAELSRALCEGLRNIHGVRVFCPVEPQNGIVSFTIDSYDVALAGAILDQAFGIGVRAGLHCAPATHRAIGTFPNGTLRASFGYFNHFGHVERLLSAVRQLSASN
ncbi:MAG TPA: aminotransferase class V-fold PLP-dependent enzyme [Firmicutes bacterium]|nr:aminotransferase class V-fold PLP-dependent enzyme [Bacillota bacterium]